jgi:hypothetical protein
MTKVLIVLTFLALAVPVTASADTLSLTPPSNPKAGSSITVTVSGEAPYGVLITLYAVSNATVCSAKREEYSSHYPEGSALISSSAGSFSGTVQLTIPTPGGYLLCGYLGTEVATASSAMTVGPSEAEEAQAKAAQEAAEVRAKQAAEVTARESAEQVPVSLLRVKTVAHPGNSSSHPGHTTIAVETNAFVHVTITLDHHTGPFHYQVPYAEPAVGNEQVAWSCHHPNLKYHYVVTAIRGSGSPLRRSGSFRTVSASRCRALKLAAERRSAEERRQEEREAEEQKRKEASPQFKIEHVEREYCEKVLRGEPGIVATVGGHIYTRCRVKGEVFVVSESAGS